MDRRQVSTIKASETLNVLINQNNKRGSGLIREASHPDFCPPEKEGTVISFVDEAGDVTELEFLGIVLHDGAQYGMFFLVDEDNPALSSGEVVVLEVTEIDDEGIPEGFELVDDEELLEQVYDHFQEATKDLYRFE